MSKNEREGLYSPVINWEKCRACALCFETCPGYSVDFRSLNNEIFAKEPQDILLGNHLACYVGHSREAEIRYHSSSGGLVTELLIFSLENGLIDGALVTKMNENNPFEPEPFIARTRKEIISAAGSKYCPVPANIKLEQILSEEGKFAVVGLPCHIQGIRKAAMIKRQLQEKIILHLGLFCSHTVDFRGTKLLLRKLGVDEKNIRKIDYRGRGWPGGLSLELKTGNKKFIPLEDYYMFKYFLFSPPRCSVCSDPTAELADISFGDAWLREMSREKIGKSILVSRSKIGEEILHNAQSEGKIEILKVDPDKVVRSQREIIFLKKKCLATNVMISRIFHRHIPRYGQRTFRNTFHTDWVAVLVHLNLFISSDARVPAFKSLFNRIPLKTIIAFNKYLCMFVSAVSLLMENSHFLEHQNEYRVAR